MLRPHHQHKDCRSGEPLTQANSRFPSTQHETIVTAFRGLVAFLQVHWHAARIGEQLALLAGYVCSHVPRLRSWKQRATHQLIDVGCPRIVGGWCRLDPGDSLTSHVIQTFNYPLALQFSACRPIAERGGTLWPVDQYQGRKVRGSSPEVSGHTLCPILLKSLPSNPLYTHARNITPHPVAPF